MCAILICKALRLASINKGSHSCTGHPHVYPHMEWAILPLLHSRRASLQGLSVRLPGKPPQYWVVCPSSISRGGREGHVTGVHVCLCQKARLVLGENNNIMITAIQQTVSKLQIPQTVMHTGPSYLDKYKGYNVCPHGWQANWRITRMWASAQRDGRPAKYRRRSPRRVWLTPTTRVACSNAAKTRKPLKFAGMPQTLKPISAASGPKFAICEHMWRTYCCITRFSD